MKKLVLFFCFFASVCFADDQLELLISPEAISEKIRQVSEQLNHDYQGKDLTLIMVEKGGICITADLMREIKVPFTLECIKASSYGENGMISGTLTLSNINNLNLESKDVLIVDDIFDTGKTMVGIIEQLKLKNPNSIKSLVLLAKSVNRKTTYEPEYVMFNIENRFVIGYGLDYKEYYRGLPGIYAFVNDTPPD